MESAFSMPTTLTLCRNSVPSIIWCHDDWLYRKRNHHQLPYIAVLAVPTIAGRYELGKISVAGARCAWYLQVLAPHEFCNYCVGALHWHRISISAIVTGEQVDILMKCKRHIAVLALRHPSAYLTFHHRCKTTTILEQNGLFAMRQSLTLLVLRESRHQSSSCDAANPLHPPPGFRATVAVLSG